MTHTCHWPGCPKQVPPEMWGCREHWLRLPEPLRDEISVSYGADPTGAEYDRLVAKAVQWWIAEQGADGAAVPTWPPYQRYVCAHCESRHDHEEDAEECCRPSVTSIWICPLCSYPFVSEEEAKSCWRSHGLDLDVMRLTAAELEAAGQERLSL